MRERHDGAVGIDDEQRREIGESRTGRGDETVAVRRDLIRREGVDVHHEAVPLAESRRLEQRRDHLDAVGRAPGMVVPARPCSVSG